MSWCKQLELESEPARCGRESVLDHRREEKEAAAVVGDDSSSSQYQV